MTPARFSRRRFGDTRLLVVAPGKPFTHSTVAKLHEFLEKGDLLVVNRSATLPSSFQAWVGGHGVEIRLAAFQGPSPQDPRRWRAFLFGAGNWMLPTEQRPSPPPVKAGDRLGVAENLVARVVAVFEERSVLLEWESTDLWAELSRHGKPIQYSYLREDLRVWDQQTPFAGPALSVEPPSSAFALQWGQLLDLRKMGVEIHTVLHGAGISSTGSKVLDGQLPLQEWSEVPPETAAAMGRAHRQGRRVIAVGTTVVRALESAAQNIPGPLTPLKISPGLPLHWVSGILTGIHDAETSHGKLLGAFAPLEVIRKAHGAAENVGYWDHEYGDLMLVLKD